MAFIPTVSILHCGGGEENHLIQYLEKAIASFVIQPFILEFRKYQESQDRAAVMSNDAQKYKQTKLPLVVLISKEFFKIVWPTIHKSGILNIITSSSTGNCLHIWMDVKEDDVKRHSTSLCYNGDTYFKRIKASDLTDLAEDVMVKQITVLINDYADERSKPHNYAIDDIVDEMRKKYGKVMGNQKGTKKKTEKGGVYKNALLLMDDEETEELDHEISVISDINPQGNAPSKRKKKKKKVTGCIKVLDDIGENEMVLLSTYLSVGHGVNWKQFAENMGYDRNVVKDLVEDIPADSEVVRSRRFLDVLRTDKPDLDIKEISLKCRQILRYDVSQYLQKLM